MSVQEKTDRELAEALVAAVKPYDEMAMLEAEDAIFERIEMSLDQTERGPTAYAAAAPRLDESGVWHLPPPRQG